MGHFEKITDALQQVDLDLLKPHPQNPRMIMRQDVIDAITAGLEGGFDPAHALLVRPLDDGYQIISGHHRFEAAKKAGIDSVPCWVRAMDDEAAYMALVTGNNQGELSPLEIGMHALHCVGLSAGGRGQKGGLSAYAVGLGKKKQTISDYVSAARVAHKVSARADGLIEKTRLLTEASVLPEEAWQPTVNWLLDSGATVAQTKAMVKTIKALLEAVPDWWPADTAKLTESAISSPNEASRRQAVMQEAASSHEKLGAVTIYKHEKTGDQVEQDGRQFYRSVPVAEEYDQQAEFRNRLLGSTMPSSSDVRRAYSEIVSFTANHSDQSERLVPALTDAEQAEEDARKAEAEAAEERNRIAQKIYNGDCIEALERYQGQPIKLLLSDPPYGMDFQSNRRTASLKTEKIADDGDYESAMKLTAEMLAAASPHLDENAHVILFCNDEGLFRLREVVDQSGLTFKRVLVWVKPNHGTGDLEGAFAPKKEFAIHAVKGRPAVSPRRPDVFVQESKEIASDHPTEKPLSLLKCWIECTTQAGDTVVDPFGGTGSTFVAAASLGREVYGAEIDAHYHQQAVARLLEAA